LSLARRGRKLGGWRDRGRRRGRNLGR
jgi:hypothetical protein